MAAVTEHQLQCIVQDAINIPLAVLCQSLSNGKTIDSERRDFERELAQAIAEAITRAVKHGVA